MHREMYKSLAKQPIRLKPFTDETITVVIKIQVDQQVKLVSFSASDNLKNQMPTLEAVIEKSISDYAKFIMKHFGKYFCHFFETLTRHTAVHIHIRRLRFGRSKKI